MAHLDENGKVVPYKPCRTKSYRRWTAEEAESIKRQFEACLAQRLKSNTLLTLISEELDAVTPDHVVTKEP